MRQPTHVSNSDSSGTIFSLLPDNTQHLACLQGQLDGNLRIIEQRLQLSISNRGNRFHVDGTPAACLAGEKVLQQLYREAQQTSEVTPDMVHLALVEALHTMTEASASTPIQKANQPQDTGLAIRTKRANIKPRGETQQSYIRSIRQHDINFGIGPAGTGKTYLAVACAVEALEREEVRRILLVRPAVEAGEKLGFLPGDLAQKIDPYLRPLYDALYEMLGFETVARMIEKNIIEIAPLAYMRGRTLNGSFVILDESQNTTREQMKMFLTRIGFGSTAVITGDVTQIDLPKGTPSGLKHAIEVLDGVNDIGFTHFLSSDIVRHPLVQRIVDAYDVFEKKNP
ncbi:MAG: PhoH family protein [Oceanospirillaceae bacterium]|jgi:phosphate starvation-inducible PhoH-like protein|nr:PhoH family protein [Oceanospirillaceae bacterium]MBT4441809.1 PhoH family protein [Oceanospirillaceae bacterium]MBT6077208.1 PhoH family protein [Oceanospirillaceae bacterium]